MTIDKDLFAGAEPDDEDELTPADRGDALEPSAEPEAPEPSAAPEAPGPEPEEPSAEPEEPSAAPEEPSSKRQPPNARIPKARFDEVNARRKAAEARTKELEDELARARGPQTPVEEFDFSAKEEEYMSAVVDGDFAKAKAVRAEIRRAEHEMFRAEALQTQNAAVSQTKAELDLRTTIQELEETYPTLDSKNEDAYDELATQEVLELHNAYLQMGKYANPADSLRAAAELIALKYGFGQADETDETPQPVPTKREATETPAQRKAAVAASQPRLPSAGSATGGGRSSVAEMSEAEFDALPESKKAELRGDFGL